MTAPKVRSLHSQVGLWSSLLLVIAALTTLLINHRRWILPASRDLVGPYSQYLLSHAICPSHPDQVLIGTSSGLFISHDGAKTFQQISLPVAAEQVVGVAFHPNEPSHYYAVLRQEGIFSSLDGGKLWNRVSFPSRSPIQSFQIGFDGSLSVVTRDGLYRRVQENWSLTPNLQADAPPSRRQQLMRWVYALHDGTFWGSIGVWLTDFLAVSILFLVATGWSMWRSSPDKSPPSAAAQPPR